MIEGGWVSTGTGPDAVAKREREKNLPLQGIEPLM
jgi:hypothetical protein